MVGYANPLQLDLRETLLEISLQKLVIMWSYASSRMSLGMCSENTTRKKNTTRTREDTVEDTARAYPTTLNKLLLD